jgi:lysophospholipase L1-like esterase
MAKNHFTYNTLNAGNLKKLNELVDKVEGSGSSGSGQTLALSGDSILNSYSSLRNDRASNDQADAAWSATGIAIWANSLLGWPFDIIEPTRIGGGKVQHIIHESTYYVEAQNPDWVFMLAGANDINPTMIYEEMINDLKTLITKHQRTTKNLVVMTILPQGSDENPSYIMEQSVADILEATNNWLTAYCQAEGIFCADLYSEFVHPDTNTKAKSFYLRDGVHPDVAGAYAGGSIIANVLKDSGLVPKHFGTFPQYDTNPLKPGTIGQRNYLIPNNGVANPSNTGTNGQLKDASITNPSGTGVPTGWKFDVETSDGSSIAQVDIIPADADDVDQTPWLQMVIVGGATGITEYTAYQSASNSFVQYDFYKVQCEANVTILNSAFGPSLTYLPFQIRGYAGGSPDMSKINTGFYESGQVVKECPLNPNFPMLNVPYAVLSPAIMINSATSFSLDLHFAVGPGEIGAFKYRHACAYRVEAPVARKLSKGTITIDMDNTDQNNFYALGTEQAEDLYESIVAVNNPNNKVLRLPQYIASVYTITNNTGADMSIETATQTSRGKTPIVLGDGLTQLVKMNGVEAVAVAPAI